MPDSVKHRLLPFILFCLGTILMAPPTARAQWGAAPEGGVQGSAESGGPEQRLPEPSTRLTAQILELTDTALIARAWQTLFPDSALPYGEYQVLMPAGPELSTGRAPSSTVYLLRNGTEVGHMERAAWEALAAASDQEMGLAESMEGPESQDVPLLWKAIDWSPETLLRWAEWPAGFSFAMGTEVSSVQSSQPQFQRDIRFTWNQKLFRHFLLGAELNRSQYGGGLTRLGETVADTGVGKSTGRDDANFWGDAFWWGSLSAGVPGLKYTLSLANQPLPRFYWLETRASGSIRERKSGRVVSQWTGSTLESDGNLSHTLDARLGILRYQFHFDTDAYTMPIQTVGLHELPGLFGTWGAGLVFASDLIATRLSVDIPDIGPTLGVPKNYPSRFRLAFLHVDLAYRNLRSFNLGISVRISVDNPIMNRPGA
ncbi:MAG: hypothetical protein M3Y08_09905 [Fibrobacterota bacterium]|nr:hypothetical protein [Fibrobacterota bacterium]